MSFIATNFILPYVGTDKVLKIQNSALLKVGGFNVCQYIKSATEAKELIIFTSLGQLVLDFATESDAKLAQNLLNIAIESLSATSSLSGTTNYIAQFISGTAIGDGTWMFTGNDILPVTTGSNIGDDTHRIGTIFMASIFDYVDDINFYNGTDTTVILTASGQLGIGTVTPSAMIDIKPSGSGTVGININTSSTQDAIITFGINNNNYGGTNFRSKIWVNAAGQETLNFYTLNNDTIFWNGAGAVQVKTLTLFSDTTAKFENNIGIAVSPDTSSRVIISGIDNTSAHYGLKIDDSVGNPLLYVRNDGDVTIGKTLRVRCYSFSPESAFWMEANAIEDTEMNTLNADLVFKTKYSGGVNSESIRFTKEGVIKVADYNYLTLGAYNSVTNKYGYLSSAGGPTAGVGLKLEVCQVGNTTGMTAMQIEAGGNVAIGTALTPTSKLHIKGVDGTSFNYGLKIDDDLGNALFAFRNDGYLQCSTFANSYLLFDPSLTLPSYEVKVTDGVTSTQMILDKDTFNVNNANGQIIMVSGDLQLYGLNRLVITNSIVNATSIQQGNSGLVTGDLYIDTAANILANGDKVVGWKV